MPPYRQRTIDAPDAEWLDLEQVAAYLNYSVGEFEERRRLECIPPGSGPNLREPQWHWQVVQAMSWTRPYIDSLYEQRRREEAERRKAAREQKRGS